MDDVPNFEYADSSLIKEPVPWTAIGTHLSPFDEKLRSAWDQAAGEGIFRYTLSDCVYKKLDLGSDAALHLPSVAILNPQRATNRRKREDFESMNEEFNKERFNFQKIKKNEILFKLTTNAKSSCSHDQNVIVNISPIEYGHVLLAPFLHERFPQRCTMESILLALDALELSSQPSFRVGFNSIHAWASVNHLHFHGMYCDHEIFCDSLPAEEHLISSCYLLHPSSPIDAFVFTVPGELEDRLQVAKSIAVITDVLHEMVIPYNIICCRGQVLSPDGSRSNGWKTRTLVFPRKSSKGLLPADPFDVACVEVGGQFPVKTQSSFDALTPDGARRTLEMSKLERNVFDSIKEKVKIALR